MPTHNPRRFAPEEDTKRRLYNAWKRMKQTCSNPNDADYPTYGGRGIKVCQEWQSFDTGFYPWALRAGYAPGLVLKRKDIDGDFCPDNCFYAARKSSNGANTVGSAIRKSSRTLTYKGEVMTNEMFARLIDMDSRKTLKKLNAGMSPEQIADSRDPEKDHYVNRSSAAKKNNND